MPSKNIAAILNNESNLRILDKLKARPYYPRELAGEMGLSEPFIVRRLKAMEEHDIVEGRWETEKNGRKVKRYYLKDVTMQLGKDGLKVTSGEKPAKKEIDPAKEIIRFLIYLPVFAFIAASVLLVQPAMLAVTCILITWQMLNNVAFYRAYRYKSMVTAIFILAVALASTLIFIWLYVFDNRLPNEPSTFVGLIYFGVGVAFFGGLIYHVRYSQFESQDLLSDKKELMDNLDSASIPVKVFYLPFAIRWKLSEYFNLV